MAIIRRPIGRISRTNFLLWIAGINLLFGLVDFWAFRRLALTFNVGFRSDAFLQFAVLPVWRVVFEIVLNLLLGALAIARLHDAAFSARWLIAVLALSVASAIPFAGAFAGVALLAWIAIFFLPPTLGPNRFGADPRGWKSREHFERQRSELAK